MCLNIETKSPKNQPWTHHSPHDHQAFLMSSFQLFGCSDGACSRKCSILLYGTLTWHNEATSTDYAIDTFMKPLQTTPMAKTFLFSRWKPNRIWYAFSQCHAPFSPPSMGRVLDIKKKKNRSNIPGSEQFFGSVSLSDNANSRLPKWSRSGCPLTAMPCPETVQTFKFNKNNRSTFYSRKKKKLHFLNQRQHGCCCRAGFTTPSVHDHINPNKS